MVAWKLVKSQMHSLEVFVMALKQINSLDSLRIEKTASTEQTGKSSLNF